MGHPPKPGNQRQAMEPPEGMPVCSKRMAYWLRQHFAAATTKPLGPETACDSLNCTDGKGAEVTETITRPN